MKKIFLSVCALGLALGTYAQAVVDNAVIPVSVNINSIMRMNVVSGGNIEFAFNTIDQYTNGISNSTRYDTKFTVASSVSFKVTMSTEDDNLIGADNASNTMDLGLVGFMVESTGTGTPATIQDEWLGLGDAGTTGLDIVTSGGGDIAANAFTIHWSCGDDAEGASGSVLSANLAPDRYSTNIFLVLSEQ
mgnify:CR=1 FL=1